MLKNKSGITLVTLIFMVIILLILASIFIAASLKALDETKKTEDQVEIHALEEAILERYASYVTNDKNVNVTLVGTSPSTKWASSTECVEAIVKTIDFSKVSSGDQESKKAKISREIIRDYDTYVKLISKSEAKNLGVEQFTEGKVYVVNYYTGSVYGPVQ